MGIDTSKQDWYKKHACVDEEKVFHKKRITFLILNDEILFLKDSEMTHYTWAMSLGIDHDKFNELVRGFYLNGLAIFYKGNFSYDDECIEKSKFFGERVKEYCGTEKLEIWCGQSIGEIGVLWPPKLYIGTL